MYLATHASKLSVANKQIISTYNDRIASNTADYSHDSTITPSDHEEADGRLLLHSLHCSKKGFTKVMIRSVDTDVVILAIAAFQNLQLDELWIAFGLKIHFRYIPIHQHFENIGEQKAKALPIFHAFTGCDTVSSFHRIGKKTVWATWKAFPVVTQAFLDLSDAPESVDESVMEDIERYVVLMYSRSSSARKVNQARKQLFASGRQEENIPPTESALIQHTKRAAFQSGHCWGKMLVATQNLPSP